MPRIHQTQNKKNQIAQKIHSPKANHKFPTNNIHKQISVKKHSKSKRK